MFVSDFNIDLFLWSNSQLYLTYSIFSRKQHKSCQLHFSFVRMFTSIHFNKNFTNPPTIYKIPIDILEKLRQA